MKQWCQTPRWAAVCPDRFLCCCVCVRPRKLQLKDLTFMVRSAIQLKYQSLGIKALARVTLTEVRLKRWSQSHWYIDKCTFRDQKKRLFSCAGARCAPLGFLSAEVAEWRTPCALSFSLPFRAFKGVFHGGAAERSTQVHACELPPSLPCQQARYWSVIDRRVVRDSQRESIDLIPACVQCVSRKLCSASLWSLLWDESN